MGPSRNRVLQVVIVVVVGALLGGDAAAGPRGRQQQGLDLQSRARDAAPAIVAVPAADSPIVAVRLVFTVGSIHDPEGKEGLAALTGLMVALSGTRDRTYGEVLEALYPMAASVNVKTGREVTVISGTSHRDTLSDYSEIVSELLLEPAFSEADLARHKQQLLGYLTSTLQASSDELLGLEMLQQAIFSTHPYGHSPAGTVAALERITLDDVKAFYREHYTRGNLIVGVAGGYPAAYPETLARRLGALPEGERGREPLAPPPPIEGRRFLLIEKETDAVGIHFGYPIGVTRADEDFYPLLVANSYLGEHRTFHGRLMQQLRGLRGLNYGDYSYIEYWDNPPGTTNPEPNVPRRQQYFSVWVRPVQPGNALFAFRSALFEVKRLIERGMTQEEFDLTRDFLISYSKLWAQSLSRRLGFHIDSRFYGMPYFIDEIERQLAALTLEEVNRAIRKHLQVENFQAVFVLDEAARLKERLEAGGPTPISYPNPVAPEVTEADKAIAALPLEPAAVRVLPVASTFEK